MLETFFFKRHLDDEEELHMAVHKHWLLGIKNLWLPTILFFLLAALLVKLPDKYVFYVVSLLILADVIWWIRNFFDYYLDTWLITDKGVIDLEWHGWFHRTASRVLYSDIEAIDYEVKGISMTLLNIGTIAIEKISTGSTISMEYVKRPKRISNLISELSEQYINAKNLKDAKTVQTILAEFVAGNMQGRGFVQEAEEVTEEENDE